MANEGKHTKGSWHVNYAHPDVWIEREDGAVIVDCTIEEDFEQAKANARLIASAPELAARVQELEGVLENLVKHVNRTGGWHTDDWASVLHGACADARAALAGASEREGK